MKKLQKVKETIKAMISIYCKGKHKQDRLCDDCDELLKYSNSRLDSCPFRDEKDKCSSCEVHCYKSEMRERIKEVMRYSGPRMITKHPLMAIKHLMHGKRPNLKKK